MLFRSIAALLVDSRQKAAAGAADAGQAVRQATQWLASHARPARALRIASLVALCVWAALDQTRFVLITRADDLSALNRASALNPHDSLVQQRKAALLIGQQRYREAYDDYARYLTAQPRDPDALVNAGVLAMQLGMKDDAVRTWQAAYRLNPNLESVRRYLAQYWAGRADTLDREGRTEEAGRAFRNTLALDDRGGEAAAAGADWFNYGQFLQRHDAEPRLVLACLISAEALLAKASDEQLVTVRTARTALERDHPDAAAAVQQSPGAALAAALARYPSDIY